MEVFYEICLNGFISFFLIAEGNTCRFHLVKMRQGNVSANTATS
jgi:hypothetical protein